MTAYLKVLTCILVISPAAFYLERAYQFDVSLGPIEYDS